MKMLEIKLTKCTLFLYESELMKSLSEDLIIKGLKRGKGILRNRKQQEREQKKYEEESGR